MKNKSYEMLMADFNLIDENEYFMILNKRIDEILLNTQNPKESLQAIICMFEAKNNLTTYYSIIAIAYALIICAVTILSQFKGVSGNIVGVFLIAILIIIAVFLTIIAQIINKREAKRAFVLQTLKFRYEYFQGKTMYEDEKEYLVKVSRNR